MYLLSSIIKDLVGIGFQHSSFVLLLLYVLLRKPVLHLYIRLGIYRRQSTVTSAARVSLIGLFSFESGIPLKFIFIENDSNDNPIKFEFSLSTVKKKSILITICRLILAVSYIFYYIFKYTY